MKMIKTNAAWSDEDIDFLEDFRKDMVWNVDEAIQDCDNHKAALETILWCLITHIISIQMKTTNYLNASIPWVRNWMEKRQGIMKRKMKLIKIRILMESRRVIITRKSKTQALQKMMNMNLIRRIYCT